MSYELEELSRPAIGTWPARGQLPEGLIFAEAAVASLRAWLSTQETFAAHEIFGLYCNVSDIETYAADGATWEPLPALGVDGGVGLTWADDEQDGTMDVRASGVLALLKHSVALARWNWIDVRTSKRQTLVLAAAKSASALGRFTEHVRSLSREKTLATWQIFQGDYVSETPPRPVVPRENVVLDDALATRLEREVIGFFAPQVGAMYAELGVPQRRGVLMYGPPGNGKTSTIRYLGGRLPEVAALVLKPNSSFNSDSLDKILAEWARQAPAMLVIEDLNWVLERVNVSTFLNALDGIVTPATTGGLLLLASTNHPELLDAALSNRPGRFDVVVEVPLPSEPLRLRYLRKQLPMMDDATLLRVAAESAGLSFAYLGELLRISGLAVIAEGRTSREPADLLAALDVVRNANDKAYGGFVEPVMSFGLHKLVPSRG